MPDLLRIVSLNIRHGGGGRTPRLMDWIKRRQPFATVLTEWRDNYSGQQIKKSLIADGFDAIATARGERTNGVLMAARRFIASEIITPPNAPAGDLVLTRLDGLAILGCYFPQRLAKSAFFESSMEAVKKTLDVPVLVIGDFNTGRNDLDIEGNGVHFDCADQFIGLSEQAGLTDLWRFRHGNRREWTWRSAKNGFRIDHAFGNQALVDHFPTYRCEIDHEPRLTGLTDHSAIILDLQ
jgi:exodeoxyribonuclease-3